MAAWKGQEVTKEILSRLRAEIRYEEEMLGNGGTVDFTSADATAQTTAYTSGRIYGLKWLDDFEGDANANEEENQGETDDG